MIPLYYFQTEKNTHAVPRDVLIAAMKLTAEGKTFDECFSNRRTKVFKYIKRWALQVEDNEKNKG